MDKVNNNEEKFTLYDDFVESNSIDSKNYNKYSVKRGLRNSDGTGVIAGITKNRNVHGYIINEGEKQPVEGELTFRGYSIRDLVENVEKEKRFGYEEIVYLLLTGKLPNKNELDNLNSLISNNRELPENFFSDMILKAPSRNIMNKLARSVLTLYSYDDNPDEISAKHEIDTAISIIAKLPVIMVQSYYAKKESFCGGTMIKHPIIKGLSTSETILSLLRPNRKYTMEEARLLDVLLMLHAEHGGGNNSTFTCRVLTSSGTDAYSAYAGAICSLKGPKHGGANHRVIGMHRYIKEHARKMAEGTEYEKEFHMLEIIEKLTPKILDEIKGDGKKICANVDMYSGFVYRMLGIPEDIFTPLFAVARMAGWSSHRFEELVSGKRIIRPAYKSIIKKKEYIPINQR